MSGESTASAERQLSVSCLDSSISSSSSAIGSKDLEHFLSNEQMYFIGIFTIFTQFFYHKEENTRRTRAGSPPDSYARDGRVAIAWFFHASRLCSNSSNIPLLPNFYTICAELKVFDITLAHR